MFRRLRVAASDSVAGATVSEVAAFSVEPWSAPEDCAFEEAAWGLRGAVVGIPASTCVMAVSLVFRRFVPLLHVARHGA